MNWKNRLTNYNFWISIVSAVLLILQAFEFHFDIMYINEIATAVLGLLVVIGIINDPTKNGKNENASANKKTEDVGVTEDNNLINSIKNSTDSFMDNEKETEKNMPESVNLNMEEIKNFPIDNQNKIDNFNSENDYKNFIENISNDISNEEVKIEEMLKNLLNLLKNTEKSSENIDFFENFLKNNENLKNKNKDFDGELNLINEKENQNSFNINNNLNYNNQIDDNCNDNQLEFIDENCKQDINDEKVEISNTDKNSSFNIVN